MTRPPAAIAIVSPGAGRARGGNRTTALRWAKHLRALGHGVSLRGAWQGARAELLIALHAGKSADSIARFRAALPSTPIVVAGTGTDIYQEDAAVTSSLRAADAIVVLQPLGVDALPPDVRERARVIYQSMPRPAAAPEPERDAFGIVVAAHLRAVKDPLLAARAARRLPASSRARVLLLGDLLEEGLREELEQEQADNPRFEWGGARSRCATLEAIARSRLVVSSSLLEGGPNVVTEALALDRPVLASDIDGHRGLLGEDYPGLFPVGDDEALAALIQRAESDRAWYAELRAACRERSWITEPATERKAWARLIDELSSA